MDYYVFAFASTHYAITAQSLLNGQVAYQVMPTPRAISSGCGISIRLEPAALDRALAVLEEKQLDKSFYSVYGFRAGDAPQKHL